MNSQCRWQAVLATALLCLAVGSSNAANMVPLVFVTVAPGIYVHQGKHEVWHPSNAGDIANLSFVVGSRCVAVIDTGSTLAIGQRMLAAIRQVTNLPICHVINTHAHPDHFLGNAAFESDQTRFIAHHNMARAQATRGQAYMRAVLRDLGATATGTRLVSADESVSDTMEIDLGDRKLQLTAHPTAHTDADLTVFEPRSQTLWLGDLAFVGHLPAVDGNLNGWIQLMAKIREIPAKTAIPGHGAWRSPGWPEFLDAQTDYLLSLRKSVRASIADGDSLTQALERIQTGQQDNWQVYDEFHQRNVSAAFAELEWE